MQNHHRTVRILICMRDSFDADLRMADRSGSFDSFLAPVFLPARRREGLQFLAEPGERLSSSLPAEAMAEPGSARRSSEAASFSCSSRFSLSMTVTEFGICPKIVRYLSLRRFALRLTDCEFLTSDSIAAVPTWI
jgi:hypothetical protein